MESDNYLARHGGLDLFNLDIIISMTYYSMIFNGMAITEQI